MKRIYKRPLSKTVFIEAELPVADSPNDIENYGNVTKSRLLNLDETYEGEFGAKSRNFGFGDEWDEE